MSNPIDFAAIPPLAGRYDLYGAVHKGLRKAQCDLLGRLGANDYANPASTATLLDDMRMLLTLAADHVEHEDGHIHSRLNALEIGTETVDDQHEDHRAAFATLAGLIRDIEDAPFHARAAAGRRLYLAFAAYVADDFLHMHEEETVTAPMLWANLTDQDLMGIEMAIVGSLPPEKNMAFMRLMIPAMNPDERAAMLGGIRDGAPREAFNAVMEFAARPNLSPADYADLVRRLAPVAA